MIEEIIEVDSKEKFIINEFTRRGIEFKTSGAAIGDIRKGNTCIERKEINDFFSNIHMKDGKSFWIDDHMQNQWMDMLQYPNRILIISGRFSDLYPKLRPKMPSFYNALATLAKNGITVLQVDNDIELVTVSLSILFRAKALPTEFRIEKRKKNAVHGIIHAASPRISGTMRQNLLDKFGCPLGIAQASKEELMEVPKVGWTIANNIHENFRKNK